MKCRIALRVRVLFVVLIALLAVRPTCLAQAQAVENEQAVNPDAPPQSFTYAWASEIKEVGSPHLSPDGKWLVYAYQKQLWIMPAGGGAARAITTAGSSAWSPHWSRDSQSITFHSNRKERKTQIYRLDLNQFGEAQAVTDLEDGTHAINWSPDETRLLLTIREAKPEAQADASDDAENQKKGDQPWVIDRLEFRSDHEDAYITDWRPTHIHVFDPATKTLTQITSGPNGESQPTWSADGKTIAFVSNRTQEPDQTKDTNIWTVALDNADQGATPVQLTDNPGPDFQPTWSPDGEWIAYLAMDDPYYATQILMVVSPDGSKRIALTEALDRSVSDFKFSHDGSKIYFLYANESGQHLAVVPAQGGPITPLVTGDHVVSDFSVADDGSVVIKANGMADTPQLYRLEDGQLNALTRYNLDHFAKVQLGAVEKVKFKSADGTPVEAFVTKPPNFDPDKTYPTILYIHGGPIDQFSYGLSRTAQFYAAHGYVVVMPNPRGSTGHGLTFRRGIFQQWGETDFEDVMASVDHCIKLGYSDPDKLGVHGYSYGGYLTNAVVTKTNRFKGAASGAGHFLLVANYGHDQYQHWYEWELGLPWENRALWDRISPFSNIDKVTTPTLLLCGQKDWNVPVINSEIMYQSLRRRGVPTQLVVYPNMHHGGWPDHLDRDYDNRILAWMNKYVKGEQEPAQ